MLEAAIAATHAQGREEQRARSSPSPAAGRKIEADGHVPYGLTMRVPAQSDADLKAPRSNGQRWFLCTARYSCQRAPPVSVARHGLK